MIGIFWFFNRKPKYLKIGDKTMSHFRPSRVLYLSICKIIEIPIHRQFMKNKKIIFQQAGIIFLIILSFFTANSGNRTFAGARSKPDHSVLLNAKKVFLSLDWLCGTSIG